MPSLDELRQHIDPNILAVLAGRRLGLEQQEQTSRRRLGEDVESRRRELGLTGERGRRDINEGSAARGLFSSGIRLNQLGEFEADLGRQTAESEQGFTRGGEDLASALRAGLLGIQSEETQAGLEGYNAYLARQMAEQEAAANAASYAGAGGGSMGGSYAGGGGGGGGTPSAAAVSRRVLPSNYVSGYQASAAARPGSSAARTASLAGTGAQYRAAQAPRPAVRPVRGAY